MFRLASRDLARRAEQVLLRDSSSASKKTFSDSGGRLLKDENENALLKNHLYTMPSLIRTSNPDEEIDSKTRDQAQQHGSVTFTPHGTSQHLFEVTVPCQPVVLCSGGSRRYTAVSRVDFADGSYSYLLFAPRDHEFLFSRKLGDSTAVIRAGSGFVVTDAPAQLHFTKEGCVYELSFLCFMEYQLSIILCIQKV